METTFGGGPEQWHGPLPTPQIGGGTSKVGDPSGKDASRQLLSAESIAQNMAGISRVFRPGPCLAMAVVTALALGSVPEVLVVGCPLDHNESRPSPALLAKADPN